MTDHDAISATIRAYLTTGGDGLLPDLPEAYLDLYDEVQRLRADKRLILDERDRTFALMLARAEKAEAERIAEWNKRRDAESSLVLEKAVCLTAEAERDRLMAERDALQAQCCMCGKTGLSTIEDGGSECELDDGRWVCSVNCYDRAVLNPLVAEAERDRLRAVLLKIAEYLPSFDYVARDEFGRCTDLPGSPYDRWKADASAHLTAIAREALKGDSDA